MPGDGEIVAELAGVTRVFRDGWRREATAVAGLSLQLRRGEVYGFLGPNGAGKTTALHCLLGLLRPTQGMARLFGQTPGSGAAVFRRVGYMPEDWTGFDFLTVTEMLEMFADLHGVVGDGRKDAIASALNLSGLNEHADRRLRRLSKGMRQRASLAQAILGEPDLLVLDEPTKELDPLGRRDVRRLLSELAQRGTTILMSSHLLSEVERTCHRVGILHRGALVAEGRLDEILEARERRVIRFELPEQVEPPEGAVKESDRVWRCHANSMAEVHAQLGRLAQVGADLLSVQPDAVRLEDYFIEVVSRA